MKRFIPCDQVYFFKMNLIRGNHMDNLSLARDAESEISSYHIFLRVLRSRLMIAIGFAIIVIIFRSV
jgi:hypothetical protein